MRELVTTPRNEGMAAEIGWASAIYWYTTPNNLPGPVEDDKHGCLHNTLQYHPVGRTPSLFRKRSHTWPAKPS